MAIPWLTVLQAVPWGEVIRNAPKVADGARTLWKKAAGQTAPAAAGSAAQDLATAEAPTVAQLQAVLQAHEASLLDLQGQMQVATQLIKDLADQNTQLVRAVETQRRWLRGLVGAALLLLGLALVVWAQGRVA
jgi:small-conductance mechanosensitive channel